MKRISPTALTAIAAAVAVYLSYLRTPALGYVIGVLAVQAASGAVLRRWKVSVFVDVLRIALAVVALTAIWYRLSEPVVWRSRIAYCLFGQMPRGVELEGRYIDSWTDYTIDVEFRADPESMKAILADSRFTRVERNVEPGYLEFEVTNRPQRVHSHAVTVSSDYSHVRILYMAE